MLRSLSNKIPYELSETVLGQLVKAVCHMSKESKRCTIATTKWVHVNYSEDREASAKAGRMDQSGGFFV